MKLKQQLINESKSNPIVSLVASNNSRLVISTFIILFLFFNNKMILKPLKNDFYRINVSKNKNFYLFLIDL